MNHPERVSEHLLDKVSNYHKILLKKLVQLGCITQENPEYHKIQ